MSSTPASTGGPGNSAGHPGAPEDTAGCQGSKPRRKGSIYTLTDPCTHCPFRSDRPVFLDEDRAADIAMSLEVGATFYCHQTLDYGRPYEDESGEEDPGTGAVTGKSRACAGSLIVMEKEDRPNQIMRIGERLGLYDRTRLNMDAPVHGSLAEWVAAHRKEGQDPNAEYCGVAHDADCANPPARRIDYRTIPNLEAPACTSECPGCGEYVCDSCWETVPESETGRDVYCKNCAHESAQESAWAMRAERLPDLQD